MMDTVAEFQSRRMETWRRVRFSLAVMAVGFGYLLFGCSGAGTMSTLCIVAFAAVAVAIGHATFTWKRLYRCPACEEPVKDNEGSVSLNPKACPNCGAKLR
jgi:DNA-directed RNA polymerase subunit RPC12/RpoP